MTLQSLEDRLNLDARAARILRSRLCHGHAVETIARREGISRERVYLILLREVRRGRRALRPWRSLLLSTQGGEQLTFLQEFFTELCFEAPSAPEPTPLAPAQRNGNFLSTELRSRAA